MFQPNKAIYLFRLIKNNLFNVPLYQGIEDIPPYLQKLPP